MRQIGVCTPGGAEAWAIFQLLYEWMTVSLSGLMARIKVDEKNCFGNGRQCARRRRGSSRSTQHQQHGNIETCLMLNKNCSRQCRRIGVQSEETSTAPLECSLVLGMVAAETRRSEAAQQVAGSLPWIGVDNPTEEQQLRADHATRMQESADFQLGGPEKLTDAHDPQHALQKNGGLADLWYMDDGDIMCHPILVPSFLQEFDVANAKV